MKHISQCLLEVTRQQISLQQQLIDSKERLISMSDGAGIDQISLDNAQKDLAELSMIALQINNKLIGIHAKCHEK